MQTIDIKFYSLYFKRIAFYFKVIIVSIISNACLTWSTSNSVSEGISFLSAHNLYHALAL